MKLLAKLVLIGAGCALLNVPVLAQHLWWKPDSSMQGATCLYGEVTVLSTAPTTYYCGCNWWPGAPAGGYSGIQDAGDNHHVMIFSIWDTSKTLLASGPFVGEGVDGHNFGNEGTGFHTHIDYNWKLGQTYQYFAVKKTSADKSTTLTTVFFCNRETKKWFKEATISNPTGGFESVKSFGGGLNAFLENWSGQNKPAPRLALYKLWLGKSAEDLVNVTHATGDGSWGVFNNQYYLASGDIDGLQSAFESHQKSGARGQGEEGKDLTIPLSKLPKGLLSELKKLEQSAP